MKEVRLRSFSFCPFDVELHTAFGIASGAQELAKNVLIRLELDDGTVGFGEAAPFPAVNGEDQARVLAQLGSVGPALEQVNLAAYREVSRTLRESLLDVPTALAGSEIALMDALCRRQQVSLLNFFGGVESRLKTDITIVTGTVLEAEQAARRAVAAEFDQLKIKVGGASLDEDVNRLRAILRAAPSAELLLDANCAYSVEEALALLDGVGTDRGRVIVFEQPTPRDDFDALAEVQSKGRVPVAADESLRSEADLVALIRTGGIAAVNIKTAKFGLVMAHDLLVAAKTSGFHLMVGGMVETELSMTASACLAAGVGGVRYVDLDTPLFMKPRPLTGGFAQRGPHLDLQGIALGHGVQPLAEWWALQESQSFTPKT